MCCTHLLCQQWNVLVTRFQFEKLFFCECCCCRCCCRWAFQLCNKQAATRRAFTQPKQPVRSAVRISLMPKYRSTTCFVPGGCGEDSEGRIDDGREKDIVGGFISTIETMLPLLLCASKCIHTHAQCGCVCFSLSLCLSLYCSVFLLLFCCDQTLLRRPAWNERENNLHDNIAYTPRYHQWLNLWPTLSADTNIWCICHDSLLLHGIVRSIIKLSVECCIFSLDAFHESGWTLSRKLVLSLNVFSGSWIILNVLQRSRR